MIELRGHTEVIQHLGAIEQAIERTPPLDEVKNAAMPILQAYPPERPNQRYRRTEDLKKGWSAKPEGSVITLDNPVSYAGLVYSDDNQAEVHKDRWPTRSKLRTTIQPAIIEVYRAWVRAILARRG